MRIVNAILSAGLTDTGRQRNVNEDRLHYDVARGIFIVVDGVGGQAAGGKAADVALSTLRKRLERETGLTADRLREAITIANNEICRLASSRPEWNGMACVLTAAIVDHGRVTIGHVGDTRLYKLRGDRIDKVTKDHSPVGEREDSGELSEVQAMRHPRRNEVYRDVGSEVHRPSDAEFVDIEEIPFEPDAALLLCSDGLTDQVASTTIAAVVNRHAGDPEAVVQSLIEKANAAGGKDNVTVVYVEGEGFAASRAGGATSPLADTQDAAASGWKRRPRAALVAVFLLVVSFALGFAVGGRDRSSLAISPAAGVGAAAGDVQIVQPTESISAAIDRAAPGTTVIVEPGEYRERIVLKDGIRLVSRVSRAATIRLPGSTSDADPSPAVVAGGANAELRGFRIVGDAATPLGIGVGVTGAGVSVIDVEISGATRAGIEFGSGSSSTLLGSDIHENPGAAMFIRAGANPRVVNNVFTRNGMSERASGSFVVEAGGMPSFQGNVFVGLSPEVFVTLDEAARLSLKKLNWFMPSGEKANARSTVGTGRQSKP